MKVKVLDVALDIPEVTISKRDFKKFRNYLSQGYHVFDRNERFYVLRKKPKVLVEIQYNGTRKIIDLRKELTKFYGKIKIEDLIERFKSDLKKHRIELKQGSEGLFLTEKR